MSSRWLFRKCDCTVYPLDPLGSGGRCRKCGVRPDREPDYLDYVKLHESRSNIVKVVLATGDKELIAKMYEAW